MSLVTMSALVRSHFRRAAERVLARPSTRRRLPGTTPAVWTGIARAVGDRGTPRARPSPRAAQSITTHLKAPDGTQVATAKFDFSNGYATVTIATTGVGGLTPGFHGVHIHKVGKCEANSVGPDRRRARRLPLRRRPLPGARAARPSRPAVT